MKAGNYKIITKENSRNDQVSHTDRTLQACDTWATYLFQRTQLIFGVPRSMVRL